MLSENRIPSLQERIFMRAGHLLCWVGGGFKHCLMLKHEAHLLSLECSNCGYRSEGWAIGEGNIIPFVPRKATNDKP